jgi:hypothetical protein
MKHLRVWFIRLGGLFNKELRDRELSAEMESHLQLHIEDNLHAGMSPVQARREAIMKLGGIEQIKENYRERRGLPLLEVFLQDLRFGACCGKIRDSLSWLYSPLRLELPPIPRSSAS